MKFKELKTVINRSAGRHDWYSITIGLGTDALIQAESPLLDSLDDYEVSWIAPSTFGKSTVTDEELPCICIHLKSNKSQDTDDE